VQGGGVHRYPTDTYYGGGEWVLLAGWLGWAQLEVGRPARAAELRAWIEAQAGPDGSLPEQVAASLIEPSHLAGWQQRWGPAASPLMWSHAMYIILRNAT
jgi:GH15 family glucan-1,4-alpha-glucosidase